ncbi:trypsin-like peptidase domain-containing protein [Actinoplanes aureus]|uniref:Serine protease n=1 Tax=Actinoplanes aureus TaxID=2792083 RepID=A0A931CGX9_9ACTN|nr:trypsin-like peptidase domain-containing protein [Actinoplanes aureus]MBG0568429.1 trypsin-like peptidase domain-containing protein [Actinoplanes aureus]
MNYQEQVDAATRRYRDTSPERVAINQQKARHLASVADSTVQLQARVDRLARAGLVHADSLLRAAPKPHSMDRTILLENIIDLTNELQAANFLSRGAQTAGTVGRIVGDEAEPRTPWGTGFLIAPSLIVTNHHVLPDANMASSALLELNYERDLENQPTSVAAYRLDPCMLFLTDERLDYTVVAVAAGAGNDAPGDTFGWNRLIREQGKIVIGEAVNLIGHPGGRRKEITIRENTLVYQLDDFLHYTSDTQRGSSGSPAFNDQWEVVALHHAAIPATDEHGNWLSLDDGPVGPDRPDQVRWVANEGLRVSVLLDDLLARDLTDSQRRLLTTMGPQALPTPATPALERAGVPAAGLRADRPAGGSGAHLVFVHGRGQQGREPARLRLNWLSGLAEGLSRGSFAPVAAADIRFPFYGDVFASALPESLRDRTMNDLVIDYRTTAFAVQIPVNESTRELYARLLEQAATRAGMPIRVSTVREEEGLADGLVRRIRRSLGWVADRSRLDEIVIATVFRDVAAYLDQPAVRDRVLAAVLDCLPDAGRIVLVSHSMGTVVAMDLIARLPAALDVEVLVTAGSPLGLDSVTDRLLTAGPRLARPVTTWINAWCPADAVAIGCPLGDDWPHVTDVITNNADGRAHDIAEYLGDVRVAQAIGIALK